MFWKITSIVSLILVVVIGLIAAITAQNFNMNLEEVREEYSEFRKELADNAEKENNKEKTEDDSSSGVSEEESLVSEGWSTYADNDTNLIFALPPEHQFGRSSNQIIISTVTKTGNNEDFFPAVTINTFSNSDLNIVLSQEQTDLLARGIIQVNQETISHPEFNLVKLSYQAELAPEVVGTVVIYYFEYDTDVYKVLQWESLEWEYLNEFLQRIHSIQ